MSGLFDTAVETYNTVNPIVDRIIVAALILLAGLLAGKLLGKLVRKVLGEIEADKFLKRTTGWKFSIKKAASNFVSYFTYFIALIMALDSIGVTSVVLNMIAGLVVIVLLVSLLFAVKDFVPNVAAGIRIKSKKDYGVGKKIKVKEIQGKIVEIGLLETKIETGKGDTILVPNSIFMKNETLIGR